MIIQSINLALRFLLELCGLIIFGYWGFKTGHSTIIKIVLGIGTPLFVAFIWGFFLAPKASVHVSAPAQLLLEIVIFGLAAFLLYTTDHHVLTWIFLVVVVLNRILMYVWHQ
jgi:Protein of unknown function (DUF2568)